MQDRYKPHQTTQTEAAVSWQGDEFERLYDTQAPLQLQKPTHTLQLSMPKRPAQRRLAMLCVH